MDRKPVFDEFRRILKRPFTDDEVKSIDAAFDEGLGTKPVADILPFVDPLLVAQLKIDEGLRLTAYKDTVGVWTVGYGHTGGVSPGVTISRDHAERLLIEDIISHNAATHRALPWLKNLDPVRRRVIENMGFNLGVDRLLGFKNTLAHVQAGQYGLAVSGMAHSLWAKQVGDRATRLMRRMATGVE